MAAREFDPDRKMPNVTAPKAKAPAGDPGFRERPAFPTAGLPGGTQRDRSAGVKRLKVTPKSIGL